MKRSALKILILVAITFFYSMAIADEISLTVYNSDLGVVREHRTLEFTKGSGRIGFTDVAARIDASSVTFELVDTTIAVEILEQNFAYDLVSADKIYNKYLDQKIDIITESGGGGSGELFSGTLLSYNGGYLIIRQSDGKIRSIVAGRVRDVTFPSLPGGLITRPTLFWLYQSDTTSAVEVLVGYQTSGINWKAEYIGILSDDEKSLDLTGWVSIDNRSGKTYKNAKLKVVAGDIHRAQPRQIGRRDGIEMMSMGMPKMATGFEEKQFFEYHLYTLPRPATIANNEIKQLTMFEPALAQVNKELRYDAQPGNKTVNVFIKTRNSEEIGLGMPLPAGRVRLFKADSDQSLILLGEDRIGHTPRNEEIKLNVGRAFDVIGETIEVSHRRVTDKINEIDYRIEIRNQKDKTETVTVAKRLFGYWEILNPSLDYIKKSANEVIWTVDVPAEGKAVIDFTVRMTR